MESENASTFLNFTKGMSYNVIIMYNSTENVAFIFFLLTNTHIQLLNQLHEINMFMVYQYYGHHGIKRNTCTE